MLRRSISGGGNKSQWSKAPGQAASLALFSLLFAVQCPSLGGKNAATHKAVETTAEFSVDKSRFETVLGYLTESPHPFGSSAQAAVGKKIVAEITAAGLDAKEQSFSSDVPNPNVMAGAPTALTLSLSGINIFGFFKDEAEKPCVVLLASHYDTKIVSGTSYVGANDSGSSTFALLEIARFLNARPKIRQSLICSIAFVFFDGEEAVLPGWDDGLRQHPARIQDNTYGSRFLAQTLASCEGRAASSLCMPKQLGGQALKSVILLDMIGSPHLKISLDNHGDKDLQWALLEAARKLDWQNHIGAEQSVGDDHIPFKDRGIPVIDLIDFQNLSYWHQPGDNKENLSIESIEKGSRLGLILALVSAAAE